jgi:hypothetical protein
MANKKRPGRPTISSEQLRNVSLLVMVQPAEKLAFQRAAELAGVGLSTWVRERLRQSSIRELESAGNRADFLSYPKEE